MTDLTEQLYAGNLPTGHYYFNNGVETYIVLYKNINSKHLILQEPEGLTVLCEVPSYEGFMTLVRAYDEVVDENTKLKELLKECELWFAGIVGNMNDKNVGEHNRNLPIGNFEHIFKIFSQKINQALGEDK